MALAPMPMRPAFRHGADTPWGGTRLRQLFQKDTPDNRTGESLEVSTIAGLNSLGADGTPLGRLAERYGKLLLGTAVKGEFPLLLKLLDAKEPLSVQVHPADAYAKQSEGKLGKSEAWIILHADPGAELVYGIREGVTLEQLRSASQQGGAVEALLRRVQVQKGDVFYIPAGTVHAIGAGIVLYEVQQSSDITYRFYDWERRDQHGNKRPLHLRQALDVVDVDTRLNKLEPRRLPMEGEGRVELLLDTPYFETLRYVGCREVPIANDPRRFAMLTALSPATLRWGENRTLDISAGQTVLLPAQGFDLWLSCDECLVSKPAVQ